MEAGEVVDLDYQEFREIISGFQQPELTDHRLLEEQGPYR
jgi:hypothetical protein